MFKVAVLEVLNSFTNNSRDVATIPPTIFTISAEWSGNNRVFAGATTNNAFSTKKNDFLKARPAEAFFY